MPTNAVTDALRALLRENPDKMPRLLAERVIPQIEQQERDLSEFAELLGRALDFVPMNGNEAVEDLQTRGRRLVEQYGK